jgi:hypothetical protein
MTAPATNQARAGGLFHAISDELSHSNSSLHASVSFSE